ncbi:chitinase domain-containing protein 1 isoform X3 [Phalaenopsis equestris]|uniref:chitinase domain-containing protein 1 isoform X3 n=1 Tax=Phalaenopsis equestris TaxID=78828 RepID=UPI0009E309DF|nr:chitinase domain-containing protein 1 isoform X3 [Phalaenopsis equestris]
MGRGSHSMGVRRLHRQTEVEPSRRKVSDEPSHGNRTNEAYGHRCFPISPSALFFFLLFLLASSFAVYLGNRSPRRLPTSYSLSIYEGDIIKSDVGYREILNENAKIIFDRSIRHFPNPVLAYITPWNSRGFEVAKEFTSKFTHISPVWYELKSHGKKVFLDGRGNVDKGWISDIRKNGNVLVLPRVVIEAFPADLLLKKKQWSKACDIILKECKEMEYDGIVLESWSRWAQYGVLQDPEMRKMGLKFIKRLGHVMRSVNSAKNDSLHLELIYVISPPHSQNFADYDFGPQDLQELSDSVDGFSLMTYAFSGPQNPGPNAPLSWIHSSMQLLLGGNNVGGVLSHAHMIFLGINLYGNDFSLSEGSGEAITGRDYLSLLEKYRPVLHWDEKSAEHYFIYSQDNLHHAVFYPSLKSIRMRLDEARAWGAGLSLWEIGQGLDYFYELL